MTIAEKIAAIRANMARAAQEAGRRPEEIALCAATKMNGADAVRIGRADFSAVCHAVGVLNPSDTCELHGLPLVLTVKCRRQKDSDELENVIRGYAAKNAAVAAPAQQPPQAAPTASAASSQPPWARKH